MVLVLAGVLLGIKHGRRRGTSTVESSAATLGQRDAWCGVALRGFCHGSLHLDTLSVTGGKVTSRAATNPVAPAT